jgi:hypothetical protein
VAISRFFPQVTSKYQLKEWQLLDDWRLFGYFILIKILNLLVDNDFLSELLKKILPLISYYLVLLLVSKVYVRWIAFGEVLIKAMRIRKWLFALSISLILMEILAVKESSDLLLLMLSGLWIFNVRFYEYRSNISFCLSVIMLLLYPVVYWFGEELIAEKIAIWGYLLLIMATIQLLSAEFKKLKR